MEFESIDYVLGSQKLSVDELSLKIDISVLEKIKNKSGIESIRICNESEDAIILDQKLLTSPRKTESIHSLAHRFPTNLLGRAPGGARVSCNNADT